jgi:very-short-patch-repair endonuclease
VRLQPESPRPEDLACGWVDRAAAETDLVDEAAAWLARRLGRSAGRLEPSIRSKTPVELAMFLDEVLPSASATGAETACQWLLRQAAEGAAPGLRGEGLARRLDAVLAEYPRPWLRVLVALGELIAPDRQPVLALTCGRDPDEPAAVAWVDLAIRRLADLAMAQPRLSLCLAIEPGLFRAYLDRAVESRAKALARESVVPIAASDPAATPGPSLDLDRAPSRLATEGASSRLLSLFEDAFHAWIELGHEAGDPAQADRARSAAERFLFERLESLPATAGLFRLNETLGFRFGSDRAVEVDLAATSLDLVVEIDRYYHFQDAESYRRDRRKDLELQEHGYLVVRVLAEDVVCRLEEVLETILAAVAFRRGQGKKS